MSHYKEYVERKRWEFGEKFDESGLSSKFAPFYRSGRRVEMKFVDGEVKRGAVGVTTGWKPCFLLMLTKRSTGSSYTLRDADEILKVVG
jgi:hypothetical protein